MLPLGWDWVLGPLEWNSHPVWGFWAGTLLLRVKQPHPTVWDGTRVKILANPSSSPGVWGRTRSLRPWVQPHLGPGALAGVWGMKPALSGVWGEPLASGKWGGRGIACPQAVQVRPDILRCCSFGSLPPGQPANPLPVQGFPAPKGSASKAGAVPRFRAGAPAGARRLAWPWTWWTVVAVAA